MDSPNQQKDLYLLILQLSNAMTTEMARLMDRVDYVIEKYDYSPNINNSSMRSPTEDLVSDLKILKDSLNVLQQRTIRLESNYNNQIALLQREVKQVKETLECYYPTFDDLGCYIKTETLITLTERIMVLEAKLDTGEF